MPRDASSSVRAVVRVRPLLQQELEAGHENCCQASGDRSILVRVGAANQFRKYSFDACLPEDRSQKQVFQESGVTCLLDAAVAGYAATVLAYGQTGSGKTYTMMGRSSTGDRTSDCGDEVKRNDGLVIRAARRLFRQIGESTGGSRITVGASFAEIFNAPGAVNECICDLLNPDAGHLQVRFSQKHGFFISDLAVAECRTLADVRAVLEAGLQNRRVNAHALNRESSRTHALFTLHIDSEQDKVCPLHKSKDWSREMQQS
ncbi:Kinesin-like protein KIF12 [Symbiodinium microadriaticum]|uniref:Kinesin-like protein KIF12 n=1 Tax=Symbiodinium microadriaticum TaxID=2951 RepID=A0A1Q9F659_SYMMI|nr:Kinesin-like protein KIF12 [Symbiodinium microadriaticum]